MNFTLVGFIVYLVVVLVIGFLTYRRTRSQEDFLLAGRKLGPWVTAFSERASGESAWLLLGLPGAALAVGLGESWTVLGCALGVIFSWFVIARGLRSETERYGALTLPEYFQARFGPQGQAIRLTATCIIAFFFTFYVAAQFVGAGKVLNVTFGIPFQSGVLLATAVIVFYTLMGGFFAVAWTDLIQGIVMIGTLIILPAVALLEVVSGGSSVGQALATAGQEAGQPLSSWIGGKAGFGAVALVLGGLSWGLGYMGQPHLVARFMAIRSTDEIRKGRIIAIAWAIPAFTGAFLVGLAGVTLYGAGAFDDPEKIMPFLATRLLPSWLAGVFISGAIAAMMSTADSQLLVTTSAITEDVYHKAMGREVGEARLLMLSRIATVVIGLIGLILALKMEKLVFEIVSYAWSGLGASFGPALLLGLHWKGVNRRGILAGMLTGALSTIVWDSIPGLKSLITVRLVAWVLAFAAVILVSWITRSEETAVEAS